jgi:Peptidase family M28
MRMSPMCHVRSIKGFTVGLALVFVSSAGAPHPAAQQTTGPRALAAERRLAATVSETRMVETVRRLVGFGTRMYGTPSNHESAAWLAARFREAGLDVTIRKDPARDWYQPVTWEVTVKPAEPNGAAVKLTTTWPGTGAPSAAGEGDLAIDAAPDAVCLTSKNPTPEATAGCRAVLFDGRTSASGWPSVARLRGTWSIPVFSLSPRESAPLREKVAAGGKVRVSFALEARRGNDSADTVVATLPGKDRSKYILFCAHGDSDSGGPGADDNASGVATVLEIARAAAAAVKSGLMPQPAWDLRFVPWGGEMSSTREYLASVAADPSHLQAVINFDQAGFGASKDALYVEPDDIPVNSSIIAIVRSVMKDHLGQKGFPSHAASVKSQGGTDSYVFQNTRTPGATLYPAVTLYTSAWDREQTVPLTEGFPPLNWYPGEKPGTITVDGDPFYHSAGDTPGHTTDTEPFDMGWCARVGLLSARRLMSQ